LRSDSGDFARTWSRYFHAASSSDTIRVISAGVNGFDSSLAGMPGAPKSVVTLPGSRSTTWKSVASFGSSMCASLATFA
jgi:hypothetical protein